MKNKDITIIVNTCDDYNDVLKLFFAALTEYWPDIEIPVVINSELIKYDQYNATTHVSQNRSNSWGKRLISTLESIESQFVIMLYDDYILEDFVKTYDVIKAENLLLEDPHASVVYLNDTRLKVKNNNSNSHFLKVEDNCDYRLNSCPALWRRKDLISFTGLSDNPWAWEVFGSYRTVIKTKSFYTLNNTFQNIFPYNHIKGGAIYRGKWVREVVENKIKKYNLDIDISIKGYSDTQLFEKRSLLWKIKFLFTGIQMIGFRCFIPLFNYLKIKLSK
jgi:hypothetical protein